MQNKLIERVDAMKKREYRPRSMATSSMSGIESLTELSKPSW